MGIGYNPYTSGTSVHQLSTYGAPMSDTAGYDFYGNYVGNNPLWTAPYDPFGSYDVPQQYAATQSTDQATTATTPIAATTTYNNTPVSTPAFSDATTSTATQYNDIQGQISALIKSLTQPTTTSTTSGTTAAPTGSYASSGFGSLYGFPQDTFYDTRKTGWNAGTNW